MRRRERASTQLLASIEDAYFDYDKHTLRPDAINALQADSTELRDILKDYPDYKLTIEGHCDERGSAEYNLALGDARAKAAKDYLVQVGIPGDQLSIISYGKEQPGMRGARRGLLAEEPPDPHRGGDGIAVVRRPRGEVRFQWGRMASCVPVGNRHARRLPIAAQD